MSHLANKFLGGISRQQRIGIKHDNVTYSFRQVRRNIQEGSVRRAAQKPVQLMKFAALAFPAHPHAFAGVPLAGAVQQQEPLVAMPEIELAYTLQGRVKQVPIVLHMLGGRIFPVADQGIEQLLVVIGEIVGLQPFHHFVYAMKTGDHDRHCDQGAVLGRDPVIECECRQYHRPHQLRYRVIDHGHRRVERRRQRQERKRDPCRPRKWRGLRAAQTNGDDDECYCGDGQDIAADADLPHKRPDAPHDRRAIADTFLELASLAAQKNLPWIAVTDNCEDFLRHFDFTCPAVAGEILDGAAVSGSACGIEGLVWRIAGKSSFDKADGFKPGFPILLGNALQAGEDILHGDVVGCLARMFLMRGAVEIVTAPQHDIAELRHGGGIEVTLVA